MKKLLLLSFAASLFAGANAQNFQVGSPARKIIVEQDYIGKPVPTGENPMLRKGFNPASKATVSVVPLATGPNAFGSIGIKTQLWADPSLNAISFIHRNDNTIHAGESSGDFRFDYSKDGGNTWTLDIGRCYTSSGANADSSIAFSIARYPQGGITNPTGNITADSAYQSWYGPSRDGSNPDPANSGDWGGHVYGSYQLAAVDTGRQEEVHSDIAAGYANLISRGHAITKVGTCYNLDFSVLQDNGDYLDNMILTKGVWNAAKRDYDYSRSLVNIPVSLDNTGFKIISDYKIAFADNGTTGYISVIGHDDFTTTPDSINYFIVYKTSDAGASWVGPYRIFLSNVDPLLLNAGAGQLYTTGFEHDAVVDVNNNLHLTVAIGPASTTGFSIGTAAGQWGIFDIYTTDGGINWCAKLLGLPQSFRGNFGEDGNATNQPLSEDSRPQASRNWSGDKLFFSWFDTDTVQYNGLGNSYPNMWGTGMDITTGNLTATTNFTGATSADGSCMYATSSYYVFDNAGTYTIPVAYCLLTGVATGTNVPLGTGVQVNFNYVNGATLADADFSVATTCTQLASVAAGIATQTAGPVTVSNNYPNPVTGTTSFDVYLLNNANVTLEVSNVLGQVMLTQSFNNMSSGSHTLTIDASKYAAGVYDYTITVGDYKVTRKMVVQ